MTNDIIITTRHPSTIANFTTDALEGSWDLDNGDVGIRIGNKHFHFIISADLGDNKIRLLEELMKRANALYEYLYSKQTIRIHTTGIYIPINFLLIEDNDVVYTLDGNSAKEHIIDSTRFYMRNYVLSVLTMTGSLSEKAEIYQLIYEGV